MPCRAHSASTDGANQLGGQFQIGAGQGHRRRQIVGDFDGKAGAGQNGQRMMAQAGFDPRAAVGLWQNMMSAGGNRPPEWLSTHPDPQARIAELQARANQLLPVYEQARAAGRRPQCG